MFDNSEMRVFISHSVADKALVSAVINLLEAGVGVPTSEIFCTSFEDQGIPSGQDFAPYMREQLADQSEVVIAIVTPQYYASAFCLCETGAAWAMKKNFIPLLVEPVDYNDLRGALYGKQGILLQNESKLDKMRDELALLFPGGKAARWNNKKAEFLAALPSLIAALKPVGTLSESEAKRLVSERDSAVSEASQLDKEKEELQNRIDELELLKDAEQVTAFKKKHSTEDQQFQELVSDASDAVKELPAVARKALFCDWRGTDFRDTNREWGSDLEDAIHRDYITDSGERLCINAEHPPVADAIEKLREVSDFLEVASPNFAKAYTVKYKAKPSVGSLNFWETHDLL